MRVARLVLLEGLIAFLLLGDVPERLRFCEALFDAGRAPVFGPMTPIAHKLDRPLRLYLGPLRLE